MTSALGGVEKGEAKHMLAATATANSIAIGFTPTSWAEAMAMGDIKTAVAVLEMKNVSNEVVRYMPARSSMGPKSPRLLTNPWETMAAAPVFSIATDIGIIAAMRMMLSQLMVL